MKTKIVYGSKGKEHYLFGKLVSEAEFNAHFASRSREYADALVNEPQRLVRTVNTTTYKNNAVAVVPASGAAGHAQRVKQEGLVGVEITPDGDAVFSGPEAKAKYLKTFGWADGTRFAGAGGIISGAHAESGEKKKPIRKKRKKKHVG